MRHTTPGPYSGQGVGTTVNTTYTYNSSTTCIYLVIIQPTIIQLVIIHLVIIQPVIIQLVIIHLVIIQVVMPSKRHSENFVTLKETLHI